MKSYRSVYILINKFDQLWNLINLIYYSLLLAYYESFKAIGENQENKYLENDIQLRYPLTDFGYDVLYDVIFMRLQKKNYMYISREKHHVLSTY